MEQRETYRLHRLGAAQYLTFRSWEPFQELRHLFTTRWGGVSTGCCSDWNLGAHRLDTPEHIRQNYEILAEVLHTDTRHMVRSSQTHTINIREVTAADGGRGVCLPQDVTDVDGLMTAERQLALVTGHADCNSLFFFDRTRQVIGLAHSGWRGTLGGIGPAMVETLQARYGCRPADLYVGIGPALCQACFEVDADVADAFAEKKAAYRNWILPSGQKYHIDLKGILRHDLLACGVTPAHLTDMQMCTKCRPDLFFSHRGQHGKRGSMAAVMMLV